MIAYHTTTPSASRGWGSLLQIGYVYLVAVTAKFHVRFNDLRVRNLFAWELAVRRCWHRGLLAVLLRLLALLWLTTFLRARDNTDFVDNRNHDWRTSSLVVEDVCNFIFNLFLDSLDVVLA